MASAEFHGYILLQIRKREWPVDGVPLLAKMNIKLQASQSAAVIITRLLRAESDGSPLRVPVDGRLSRGPIRETLSLLMDAADACMASPWRRLKSCESLFETLLSGVAQMGGLQGNQLLRIFLLRVKSLVLATCAQVRGGLLVITNCIGLLRVQAMKEFRLCNLNYCALFAKSLFAFQWAKE